MEALGKRVRDARMRAKLTQGDLAQMIGAEQTAVSRIEVREGYEPGAFLLYRIAKALDTSVDALLDGAVDVKLNARPARSGSDNGEVLQLREQVGQIAANQAALVDVLQGLQRSVDALNKGKAVVPRKPPRRKRRAS